MVKREMFSTGELGFVLEIGKMLVLVGKPVPRCQVCGF